MGRKDQLITLGAEIQQIRGEIALLKKKLSAAESRFDGLLAATDSGEGTTESQADGTLVERIVELLDNSEIPVSVESIASHLGQEGRLPTLRTTLARLASKGAIRRFERGSYVSTKETDSSGATPDADPSREPANAGGILTKLGFMPGSDAPSPTRSFVIPPARLVGNIKFQHPKAAPVPPKGPTPPK